MGDDCRATPPCQEQAGQGRFVETLRTIEAQYRAIVPDTHEIVFSLTREGRIDFISPQARRYGYCEDDLLGHPFAEFIHSDDRARTLQEFSETMASGRAVRTEFRVLLKEGKVAWAAMRGSVRRDSAGKLVGLTGVMEDITERQQTEEARGAVEARFRAIFENSDDAIIVSTEAGFVDCNRRTLEIFGLKRKEEFIRLQRAELFPPTQPNGEVSLAFVMKQIRIALSEGNRRFECIDRRANGEEFPAEVHLAAFDFGGQRLLQGVLRDITGRKRAEEALRENERKLDAASRIAHLGYWEHDLTTQQGAWSDEIFRIFGLKPQECQVTVAMIMNRIHPADREAVAKAVKDALAGIRDYEMEYRIMRPDGTVRVLYSRGEVIRGPDGRPVRRFGIVLDITDRKQAEEELRESEARFRAVYETSNDALILSNEQGFIDCNRRTLEMFGYQHKEEFLRLPRAAISPPAQPGGEPSLPAAQARIRKAIAEGNNRFEWVHRRASREDFPAEVLLSAFDVGGQRIFQAAVRDLTERKRVEAALRESEERVRLITETMDEIFWMVDAAREHALYASPAYERIWGRSLEECYTQPRAWCEALHPDDRARVLANLEQQKKAASFEHEYRIIRPDGAVRWILDRGYAVRGPDGQIKYFVGVAQDITARKQAEDAAETLRGALYHAARVTTMGELAAGLAHELNQPLAAIMSNAQAAQRLLAAGRLDHKELTAILADVVADDQRAAEVIRHTRAMLQKRAPERRPVGLNAVIHKVAELLQGVLLARSVTLTFALAPDLPRVPADLVQIQQVILNIILNALQAMEDRPPNARQLSVRTAQTDAHFIQVTITDSGAGIPAGELPHLFEPFFTTKKDGLGMGLRISHSIIQAHGGRIWAANNAGRGATVGFTLPIGEEQ